MSHVVEVQITHSLEARLEEGHEQKTVALRTMAEVWRLRGVTDGQLGDILEEKWLYWMSNRHLFEGKSSHGDT